MGASIEVLNTRAGALCLPAVYGEAKEGTRGPMVYPKQFLKNGINTVSEDRWLHASDHPAVKQWVKMNWLKVEPSKKDVAAASKSTPDALEGLQAMKIQDARVFIQASSDVEQLMSWRNKDDRIGIHKAIDDQIEHLRGDAGDELED